MTQMPSPSAGTQPPAPSGQPKPAGLAIASLVCGIAGFPMIFACFSGIAVGIVGAVIVRGQSWHKRSQVGHGNFSHFARSARTTSAGHVFGA